MKIVAGETVSFVVSLLERVTKTPPEGAGCASNTWIFNRSPGIIVRPVGRTMSAPPPREPTVTLATALGTLGALATAVMVAEPAAALVTGTFTLVALAANVTVPGTPTEAGLLDVKLMESPPAGAGAERFS